MEAYIVLGLAALYLIVLVLLTMRHSYQPPFVPVHPRYFSRACVRRRRQLRAGQIQCN